jgi:hypothetical protein
MEQMKTSRQKKMTDTEIDRFKVDSFSDLHLATLCPPFDGSDRLSVFCKGQAILVSSTEALEIDPRTQGELPYLQSALSAG